MQKVSSKEDKMFNMRKFWGSALLAPHVDFRRDSEMYCVYCGKKADTREHCPSKAFLKKPLPTNLPTVPACKKCNNSFSSDERFTKKMIDFLYMYYMQHDNSFIVSCSDDDRETKEAREAAKKFTKQPYFDERMANVFRKLAICHAAYEISIGFYSDDWKGKPKYISYVLHPMIDEESWKNLEHVEVIDNDCLPEIGSRAFGNIYVLQLDMQAIDREQESKVCMCILDWVDIQDGNYKYQAFLREDVIYVKMIFNDFLYAEVTFEREI